MPPPSASQFTPFDANTDFTMIMFMAQQMIALLDTVKPVQVIAVHPGTGSPPAIGTVDVTLLVSQIDGAGNVTASGNIYGLPFFRFQGGPWAIVCDPAVNDYGFILCADRDISAVVANPGVQAPGSNLKYNASQAIYVGGFINPVPAGTLWLKPDGTWELTDKPGNVLQGRSSGITATPASGGKFLVNGACEINGTLKVDQLETGEAGLTLAGGNLTVSAGSITASGDIIATAGASQVSLTNHTQSDVTTGSGVSGPPVPGT